MNNNVFIYIKWNNYVYDVQIMILLITFALLFFFFHLYSYLLTVDFAFSYFWCVTKCIMQTLTYHGIRFEFWLKDFCAAACNVHLEWSYSHSIGNGLNEKCNYKMLAADISIINYYLRVIPVKAHPIWRNDKQNTCLFWSMPRYIFNYWTRGHLMY